MYIYKIHICVCVYIKSLPIPAGRGDGKTKEHANKSLHLTCQGPAQPPLMGTSSLLAELTMIISGLRLCWRSNHCSI